LEEIHALSNGLDLTMPLTADQRLTAIFDKIYDGAPHVARMKLLRQKINANAEMRAKLTLEIQEKKREDSRRRESASFPLPFLACMFFLLFNLEIQEYAFKSGGKWLDKDKFEEELSAHKANQAVLAEEARKNAEGALAALEAEVASLSAEIDRDEKEISALKSSISKSASLEERERAKERLDAASATLSKKRRACGSKKASVTRMKKRRTDPGPSVEPFRHSTGPRASEIEGSVVYINY